MYFLFFEPKYRWNLNFSAKLHMYYTELQVQNMVAYPLLNPRYTSKDAVVTETGLP